MKKQISLVLILVIICILLCACQESPTKDIVTSKNDGSFDINAIQSATEPEDADSVLQIQYSEDFHSTDNSLAFSMCIDEAIDVRPMPIVEVIPHYLTGDDSHRIAQAIFGNVIFYEREPSESPQYSKDELREKIQRLSQYASQEALEKLYGVDYDMSEEVEHIKSLIDTYTKQLESAPDENPHIVCDWILKKERNYNNTSMETAGRNVSEESDVIYSSLVKDGVEYIFTATTRNKDDYKVNTIHVGLTSGVGPVSIDQAIYRSMLCRTDEPTEDQISSNYEKAQLMLTQMGLGEWQVAESSVQTVYYGDIPEYSVIINATPVINNIPVLYGQQLESLTSDSTYVSNYPMTFASFEFSADGKLITFLLRSPITIKNVVNENVATIPITDLLEKAKIQLSLCDSYASLGVPSELIRNYEYAYNEPLVGKVEINKIDFGLARIKVPNLEDSYYYVPSLVVKGDTDYYGKNSGNFYVGSSDLNNQFQSLIWLNAVDGSILG